MPHLTRTSLRLLVPIACAAVALVALTGCNEDSVERSLGSQTADAVERHYMVDKDPLLNEYVTTMGQMLVAHSSRQQIPYRFRVLDTDMVNAFAAPYGHVYFLRGMLDFADTEDEVWFVAAHEVTHIVKRDSIKSLKNSILFNIGVAIIGGESRTVGDIAGIGAGLLMLRYSRDDERDADDGGCDLAYSSGYDPRGSLAFFERLEEEYGHGKPSSLEQLLLTHPANADRIKRQLAREVFSPDAVEPNLHIARGYQRRSQFIQAAQAFSQAAQANPSITDAHTGLGDCFAAIGRLQEAKAEYQKALNLQARDPYALRQLAAVPQNPATLPAPAPADATRAGVLLAQAGALQTAINDLNAGKTQFEARVAGQMSQAVEISRDSSGTILGLSESSPEFTTPQQDVFMGASAAIGDANSAVYAVEAIEGRFEDASARCTGIKQRLQGTLSACKAGKGAAGDVAIAERSLVSFTRAVAEFDMAADAALPALAAVVDAQNAAEDTATYLELMTKYPKVDKYNGLVKQAAEQTGKLTEVANNALGKSKKVTRQAEARALLARINIAGLGINAEMRDAFDGMVAHYTMSRPEDVAKLRAKGMGHGDAAFALAASKATGLDPASYTTTLTDHSMIDAIAGQGVKLGGPIVLLRYLANAMEKEIELAEQAG